MKSESKYQDSNFTKLNKEKRIGVEERKAKLKKFKYKNKEK